jgi:hypothetical protein
MPSRRATETQLDIMRALSAGHSPFSGATGRSEHGGRASSLYSMVARGWVRLVGGEWALTPQGQRVLRERG